MARIGIVASMFREVHPLVRNMEPARYLPDRHVQLYHNDKVVIAYGGMGQERATAACHAVLASGDISAIASIGWAGALNAAVTAGQVVEPVEVIDALTGQHFRTVAGRHGSLVTVQVVAGIEEKRRLAEQYHGDFVDMEAAAVARCARDAALPFYCLKAISDAHDARLPDMNRFNRNGQFSAWRFIAYIAVRPTLWRVVSDMSQASLSSRDALCKRVEQWVAELRGSPVNPQPHS